jgi:hypothetical protein
MQAVQSIGDINTWAAKGLQQHTSDLAGTSARPAATYIADGTKLGSISVQP